jgi:hypothetical protein
LEGCLTRLSGTYLLSAGPTGDWVSQFPLIPDVHYVGHDQNSITTSLNTVVGIATQESELQEKLLQISMKQVTDWWKNNKSSQDISFATLNAG